MIKLRPATLDDTPTIVALNETVVDVTSPMDTDRFHELFRIGEFCIVAEQNNEVIGFVLAMKHDADYANGNYNWFAQRLKHFIYIDRIVIAGAGRGHGLGGKLYHHVAAAAKTDGCLVMAAEMDLDPPNVGSLTFHEKHGFVKLGSRKLDSGKTVSMQVMGL